MTDLLLRKHASGWALAKVAWIALILAPPAFSQFQKKSIIGDDTLLLNGWLYPKGPDANPFRKPSDPQFQGTRERILLGKMVFWDEQLSADGTMSCGTCHFPTTGGGDARDGALHPNGKTGSLGVLPQQLVDYGDGATTNFDRLVTPRNAPTMIGAGYFEKLFWDRRAGPDFPDANGNPQTGFSLFAAAEAQVAGPPISEVEMGHFGITWTSGNIQAKLGASRPLALATPATIPPDVAPLVNQGLTYDQHFDNVFGTGGVTRNRIAMAVAHYMRSLIPNQAPIDIPFAMTQDMRDGFDIMNDSNCFQCHSASVTIPGTLLQMNPDNTLVDPFDQPLSDGRFHFINLPPPGDILEDGSNASVKTPTLRNVGLRRRFFHSGQFSSLADIVAFYNGEIGNGNAGFNHVLDSVEKGKVLQFLGRALTDPRVAQGLPPFDRPDLYSERVPFETNEYGTGTAGTGGLVPEILANAPPNVGNAFFKVGVGNALAGATAILSVSNTQAGGPNIWIGPPTTNVVTTINAQSIGTASLPIANDPTLIGTPMFMQWTIVDPAAPFSRARSDAAGFTIF